MITIADRLNKIIKEKNLKPVDLAKLLDKSKGNISNLLKGVSNPSSDFITLLQEKLNVNPAWLLTGEGKMFLNEEKTPPAAEPQHAPITPQTIKDIRYNNRLKQEELAVMLGVSDQYISDLERGVKPITSKIERKLKEKGFVGNEKTPPEKDDVFYEQRDLTNSLTEKEKSAFEKIIKEDKEAFFLFYRAWQGDARAFKALKALLEPVDGG